MMVKCSFCGVTHVPNTLFCKECGAYLLTDNTTPSTDPLGTDELGWTGDKGKTEAAEGAPESRSIHLKICDSDRVIEIPLTATIVLGRIDPSNNVFPEIDLSQESGVEQGISRRHAQIIKKGELVMVEDMGSLNGTFINGRRLAAYYPEVLHHGDQLQLGKLLIDIALQ